MTPDQYRAAIEAVGVTPSEWARASGQHIATVHHKTNGSKRVKALEVLALTLAARHAPEIKAMGTTTSPGRPKKATAHDQR